MKRFLHFASVLSMMLAVSCTGLFEGSLLTPAGSLGAAPGYVSVALDPVCTLTSATGGDCADELQRWEFRSEEDVRVRMTSWRCREDSRHHIGYHLTLVELDVPGLGELHIPLTRTEGDDYISGNKGVAGAHLNDYRITDGGTHLDFDLSVDMYLESAGDIHIVFSGPVQKDSLLSDGLADTDQK